MSAVSLQRAEGYSYNWDLLEQWKCFCKLNSTVDKLQMGVADELRGESFEKRYAALKVALEAGSVESFAYLFEKKIVRVEELTEAQQLECWKGVKSVEMRAELEKQGFKISPQDEDELLRHVKANTTHLVFESFLQAGVEGGLEALYEEIKKYDTIQVSMIRSYVLAIRFCRGDDVPLETIDKKAFEVIMHRLSGSDLKVCERKQLAALWIFVCKFDHFDEKEGSFFTKVVDLFFAKEEKADVKFSGFVLALKAVTEIPQYLLEKGKIMAEELTQEQHSQCWTIYDYIATAPLLKQSRFNVNAETVIDSQPTYPINIVVQMTVDEDVRLSRVTDLLESGATSGVQEALAYCKENNLQKIVKRMEYHLACQRFLKHFDELMTKQPPKVEKVLMAVKRFLECGGIRQIVLTTKHDLGPDFYAIDLQELNPTFEKLGICITMTYIYQNNGTYQPHQLKEGYSPTAGCKFKVTFI